MSTIKTYSKKIQNAWAFYDWANSVYSLVVTTAIFPIFYTALVDDLKRDGAVEFMGSLYLGESLIFYTTALGFLIVALISPMLSGMADYTGKKRKFLSIFCYLGATATIGLFFFDLDNLGLGLLCYLLAIVGFWGSLVFYNSYLPEIAPVEEQDKLSARGFSMGYVGSVILLVICLGMIMGKEALGFAEDSDLPVRLSFLLVGLWWMGFAQVTLRRLPAGEKKTSEDVNVLKQGFNELGKVWSTLSRKRNLKAFLLAFFVYNTGVQTVILAASYFGAKEINWGEDGPATGMITSIILIQLIAILGAVLMSRLSKKIGNKAVLIIINVLWAAGCVAAFMITEPVEFYLVAMLVGLVMGGIQSLSRSTYSKMIPTDSEDTASFFSFYDVSEKVGIVLGMFAYGWIADAYGGPRYAILFLGSLFIVGILLLLRLPGEKE